ncbi:FtsX-like permease family protein [Paenibacillus rhizoplanae]
MKFYGLLKMIGTTPRQLRRIIAIQARLLYLIALPFGLGSGYMTGRWVTPLTTSLSGEVKGNSLSSSPWIFAGAALFSFLTVWIAAHKPGRLAADIAPVEAVKFSGVQNSEKKNLQAIQAWSQTIPDVVLQPVPEQEEAEPDVILALLKHSAI